ncbi:MAG: ABC transporter ATP-binding protein [Methylacidiphilales bacterium]|nr:ABC transporter ATP-binding protein [Candidatus Methylacidiphilales bacterium]MDW8348891.1 ABC transporter ATP-binding protein [Verrucomicrobiae bacterium]
METVAPYLIQANKISLYYRIQKGFIRGFKARFQALHEVSLTLRSGDRIGLIGRNGAGKTTLLQILARIIRPDKGTLTTAPHIRTLLLSIAAGFESSLTGRQNALLSALYLGLDHATATSRLPEIQSFSELEDFFDQPLYTYSSGMVSRLGFAVALQTDPDVLLIDEILSVGDHHFQEKSKNALLHRLRPSQAVLIATHDLSLLQQITTHTLWLENGRVRYFGPTPETLDLYQKNS